MQENQTNDKPAPDWRSLRAQERAERRAWRGSSGWLFGAILVLVGVLLLMQNLTGFTLHNWWALFILIPAAGFFAAAWRILAYSRGGTSAAAIGPFLVGLLLVAVTAAFLFELNFNWGLVGPIVLILLGVSALFGALGWRR